jgi:hypothetical protein
MEEENKQVEIVEEPKIESRFGYQKSDKKLSQGKIKLLMFGSALALGSIFWMRGPEKSDSDSSRISTPETSQVGGNQQMDLENYSAEAESNQMQERNRQKSKRAILVKLPGLQKITRTRTGQIPAGTEIKARLFQGASGGIVRAELLESFSIQGETYLKAGAIVVGQAKSTQERLFIQFSQIVHRDKSVESIQAQAAEIEDRKIGLKGSQFKRYAMKYGTVAGLNFIGGMTEGLQERTVMGGQVVAKSDMRNAMLNGLNHTAIQMANDQVTNLRNHPPEISIESGKEILIIFESTQ